MNLICSSKCCACITSGKTDAIQIHFNFLHMYWGRKLNLWLGKISHSTLDFENWNKKKEHSSRTGGDEDVTKLYGSLSILRVLLLYTISMGFSSLFWMCTSFQLGNYLNSEHALILFFFQIWHFDFSLVDLTFCSKILVSSGT